MMFSKPELELLHDLLEHSADEFTNHGCNDFRVLNTDENWELVQKIEEEMTDGDRETTRPPLNKSLYTYDWIAMRYFAHKILTSLKEAKNIEP